MTNRASMGALLELLRERQTFVITSHARPDGDAIGSSLGMMHLLHAMGKQAVVALADPVPVAYDCLPGVQSIARALPEARPDAVVLLECDSVARTGYAAIPAGLTINIDHHLSGRRYADFNWIDPEACAVGAMVYDLARAAELEITPAMASCLYAAVLTDTGSFTYSSTNAATFALASDLMERGADANAIVQAVYLSHPVSRMRLLGTALDKLRLEETEHGECPVAWSSITLAEMQRAGACVEDCEGVVNYLIAIGGVRAAVLLREVAVGPAAAAGLAAATEQATQFRLSLRSKGALDVARVAEGFGGGGHRNASGCTLTGSLEGATQRIVEALRTACLATPATPAGVAAADPEQPATLLA